METLKGDDGNRINDRTSMKQNTNALLNSLDKWQLDDSFGFHQVL